MCLVKIFWKRSEEIFSKMSEKNENIIFTFSIFSLYLLEIFSDENAVAYW